MLTDGRTDGRRTENRTPISHPATSRCDNKSGVLDLSFIHMYIIIKYRSSGFRVKSPIIMRVMALFSTSFFAKYLHVGEDGSGRGHLCHIDKFLVQSTTGYCKVF